MRQGALLAAVLVAGCQDVDYEPHFGRLVMQGEHLEIWASPGVEVCGGNIEYLDAFVDALREEVGPHPEAEENRRYYVLGDEDWRAFDAAVNCRGHGCTTQSRTVYMHGSIPSTHEMVHAELFTDGHRFLEEGLAMVYGEPIFPVEPADYSVEAGLRESWVAPEAYARAGHFASFVIDHHGVESLIEAKDALSYPSSFAEVSAAFEDVLGEPLDTLLDEYEMVDDDCQRSGYQRFLVECDQLATPWIPTERDTAKQLELNLTFDCVDGNVLGPYDDRIFVTRSFELGRLRHVVAQVEGGDIMIARCNGVCEPYRDSFVTLFDGGEFEGLLAPGKYTIRIAKRLGADGSPVVVRLTQYGD